MPQLICFKCPWAVAIEAAAAATALQMFAGGGQPVTLAFGLAVASVTYVSYQIINLTGDPVVTTVLSSIAYYGGAYYADVPLSMGHLLMFAGIIGAWNFYLAKYLNPYIQSAYNEYNVAVADAQDFVYDTSKFF